MKIASHKDHGGHGDGKIKGSRRSVFSMPLLLCVISVFSAAIYPYERGGEEK
jgi:hypothetical protein